MNDGREEIKINNQEHKGNNKTPLHSTINQLKTSFTMTNIYSIFNVNKKQNKIMTSYKKNIQDKASIYLF